MAVFGILAVLFVAVVVAGVVTGTALLIAGVAKNRRGVWVTGLVMLLISLGIIVALGIVGLLWFFAASRPTQPASVGARAVPAAVAAAVATTIEDALALPPGVNAPPSTRMLSSSVIFFDGTELRSRAVIQAGPDFDPLLADYFEKVAWDRIAPLITTPHFDPDDSEWSETRLGKLDCYQRIAPDGQDPTRPTVLCRDRQAGRLYCAWIEKL